MSDKNNLVVNDFFSLQKKIIVISLGSVLLTLIFPPSILLILLFIICCICIYQERALLVLIIIGYLTTPTEYIGELRPYINIIVSILLIILFIRNYGTKYSRYKKIPKELIFYFFCLFLSLIISSVFSPEPSLGFFTIITMISFFLICYIFYSLIIVDENISVFLFSIYAVAVVLGFRMLMDLFILGVEKYFFRSMLKGADQIYSSGSYTGFTVFFISLSLITANFFMSKLKILKYKIILVIFLVFNIIIILLANSRGGLIAAFFSISFFLIVIRKSLFYKLVLFSSFILILLLLSSPTANEIFNSYLRWEKVDSREIFWESGVDAIKSNILFGIGTNMFPQFFINYAPSKTRDYFKSFDEKRFTSAHPHNLFLLYAAENGILGFLISISFFILFFYFAFKTMKLTRRRDQDYFILSTAITGIGIGIFFRSFLEVTGFLFYGYITTDLPFWIVFAILISIFQKFSKENI